MQRKVSRLLFKICSVIILLIATTCTVFANSYQECYLESEEKGNYNVPTVATETPIQTRLVDSVTEQIIDADPDAPIIPNGRGIGCKPIPYGNSSVHFMNLAEPDMISGYKTNTGATLLKTTVPGVVYTVELLCIGCPGNVDLKLLPSGSDNMVLDDYDWQDTDNNWKLRFQLFITPDFKPTQGITNGHLIPGEIAAWYIGIETQAWKHFIVTDSTLTFTVEQPTCNTVALVSDNSVRGSTVSLGDTPVSAITSGVTGKVPFRIRGDQCAASKITVKLNAKNPASDATLVGKSSGSASGVAVKVFSDTDTNKEQLKADGSNGSEFTYENWKNDLLYFPFTAQLVLDGSGSPVTPGSFSGNATFSFYYE